MDALGNGCGSEEDDATIVPVVPVKIVRAFHSAGRRFTDLSRTTDEGHLTMPRKVILQHSVVQAESGSREAGWHKAHCTGSRRIVQTILR